MKENPVPALSTNPTKYTVTVFIEDVAHLPPASSPAQVRTPLGPTTEGVSSPEMVSGEYSCLKVDLIFKREFSYYLIQIYIPSVMLVIVSWVSFWLDHNSVVARVSLGVTTLLTMSTQTAGINASLPPVSYTKAIDVWTGACLTFVFGALLEYALVNYAGRSDVHRDRMRRERMQRQAMDAIDGTPFAAMKPLMFRPEELVMEATDYTKNGCFWRCRTRCPSRAKRIDIFSRVFFPCCFTFFNICYWTYYVPMQTQVTEGAILLVPVQSTRASLFWPSEMEVSLFRFDAGLNVTGIVTDRSLAIAKLLRENFPKELLEEKDVT
ncbi:unnamed protein product [Cyprideis torosa]|uniref:Neurotransmitter-gated ion-channel transmembrane domain-containing protein n=1 Tax=Cyprideis torosa TaxID=163714 RepID=A0A7R8ZM33_9CRUS|nr:unnamed protein product [Cyprideis torosa]CAG0894642.1 unnamed protein product [Cyprideis torosa]